MGNANHVRAIAQLSESEGVFTTAQARRMDIPRDALHDAARSGRIERIMHGAYRMTGSSASFLDELTAIWKLTAPAKFTHERIRTTEWDGIAAGGSSASAVLDIGDLHLSPYRLYSPQRFNTRNPAARFIKRTIERDEVTFIHGLPVTRPERTIFDLIMDDEDQSLVADVLADASRKYPDLNYNKLQKLLINQYGDKHGPTIYQDLLKNSGALGTGRNT